MDRARIVVIGAGICGGGVGIQSSPAIGQLAADLLLGRGTSDPALAALDPGRFFNDSRQ